MRTDIAFNDSCVTFTRTEIAFNDNFLTFIRTEIALNGSISKCEVCQSNDGISANFGARKS